MKIELEIPDKYEKANLYLMWGNVPIARWKLKNQYWEIKTDFCSNCGECCKAKNTPFYDEDRKSCIYLIRSPGNGMVCGLGKFRPFGCCVADSPVSDCTVKWKRAD